MLHSISELISWQELCRFQKVQCNTFKDRNEWDCEVSHLKEMYEILQSDVQSSDIYEYLSALVLIWKLIQIFVNQNLITLHFGDWELPLNWDENNSCSISDLSRSVNPEFVATHCESTKSCSSTIRIWEPPEDDLSADPRWRAGSRSADTPKAFVLLQNQCQQFLETFYVRGSCIWSQNVNAIWW